MPADIKIANANMITNLARRVLGGKLLPGAVYGKDHALRINNADLGRQSVDDSNCDVAFNKGGAHLIS